MSEARRCKICQQAFPLTRDFFYRGSSNGYSNFCKRCQSIRRGHIPKSKPLPVPEGQKRCTKCGMCLPANAEFFNKRKDREGGLSSACRKCRLVQHRQWEIANSEKCNKARRDRRRKNPEPYRAHDRGVYHNNRAAKRSRQHEYEQTKRGREIRRAIAERYRARKHQAAGYYAAQDIVQQYKRQKGRCYYCHAEVHGDFHVDHVIPLSRGGTNDPSNLVIACAACNMAKHDKLPHEWTDGGRLL